MRHPNAIPVRIALAAAFILAHMALVSAQEPPEIGTEEGQMYPDFILPAVDGGEIQLSDYRGKKVLLFHFASW